MILFRLRVIHVVIARLGNLFRTNKNWKFLACLIATYVNASASDYINGRETTDVQSQVGNRKDRIDKNKNFVAMQLKSILLFFAIVGAAFASPQRGHYAGVNRPILGSRYQNENTAGQTNFVAPVQGQMMDNRFNSYPGYQQMPMMGFGQNYGGFGYANQGFNNFNPQAFPYGYYGR